MWLVKRCFGAFVWGGLNIDKASGVQHAGNCARFASQSWARWVQWLAESSHGLPYPELLGCPSWDGGMFHRSVFESGSRLNPWCVCVMNSVAMVDASPRTWARGSRLPGFPHPCFWGWWVTDIGCCEGAGTLLALTWFPGVLPHCIRS